MKSPACLALQAWSVAYQGTCLKKRKPRAQFPCHQGKRGCQSCRSPAQCDHELPRSAFWIARQDGRCHWRHRRTLWRHGRRTRRSRSERRPCRTQPGKSRGTGCKRSSDAGGQGYFVQADVGHRPGSRIAAFLGARKIVFHRRACQWCRGEFAYAVFWKFQRMNTTASLRSTPRRLSSPARYSASIFAMKTARPRSST